MKFFGRTINRNEIFGVEKVILDFAGIFPNDNFPNWKILTTVTTMSLMIIFQVGFLGTALTIYFFALLFSDQLSNIEHEKYHKFGLCFTRR